MLSPPTRRLIENYPSVSVFHPEDYPAGLAPAPITLHRFLRHPTRTMPLTPQFQCEGCGQARRVLVLVADRWRCRECHGLDYASRHGVVRRTPGLARALRLRKRLGLAPEIGGPIPRRKRSRTARHWRWAYELRSLEQQILSRMGAKSIAALSRANRGQEPPAG